MLALLLYRGIRGTVFRDTPAPGMTVLDKALVNVDKLLGGASPPGARLVAVMHVRKIPSMQTAKRVLGRMAKLVPRFGSIAKPGKCMDEACFMPTQITEEDLESYHLNFEHAKTLSEEEERDAVHNIAHTALDPNRPLWRMDFVSRNTGGGIVVFTVSHALADGLRLVKAAAQFCTFADGSPAELELLKRMSATKRKISSKSSLNIFNLLRQVVQDFGTALTLDQKPPEIGTEAFHKPSTLLPATTKRDLVTGRMPFAPILEIKKKLSCSVNDVILCAFLGALKSYSKQSVPGSRNSDHLLRALCAVALPDDLYRGAADLYNDFLLVSLRLPFGVENREERLKLIRELMGRAKRSLVGIIQVYLTKFLSKIGLDKLIAETQKKIFALHSFVYSNVPGFQQPIHIFEPGHEVEKIEVYYPNMVNQCIFLSYRGDLSMSLTTDTERAIRRPLDLFSHFRQEIEDWNKELIREK